MDIGDIPSVCVVINPNAVGAAGVLRELRALTGVTVHLLERSAPERLIAACAASMVEDVGVRFLAGGGDGTLAAVARAIAEACATLDLPPAALAPLALGTGNELSRVLGWGPSYGGGTLPRTLQSVARGRIVSLDQWKVWRQHVGEGNSQSSPTPLLGGSSQPTAQVSEELGFQCFFSMGFDAAISHEFTLQREKSPGSCSSVVRNKAWYAWFGACELFNQTSYLERDAVELRVDGMPVPLPEDINTVQLLNIHSSADGIDFFGTGRPSVKGELQTFQQPCIGDGLLEVVGTRGVSDLLSTRMRARHSFRLAQGRVVEIFLAASIPVQMDGETWIQTPCNFKVEHRSVAPYVVNDAGRTLNCELR
ncbi:hypothetical protein CYMTET_16541 [Cymbomonas tetramitiformis]|uniref:Diacylglycerol kinase n=1 Tax=Cymbomonas tetramitiformis TaxID=36881 RepID=A0AAE0GC08_9CHLO|nr:hypothetical protein CYMTET_16541 [Cymbomonas tetramitiformis]